MSTEEITLEEAKTRWHGSLKSYIIGFSASMILTALSFGMVIFHWMATDTLLYTIVGLALLQAVCQLLFFLHLGHETKPRWELMIFCAMVLILLIIAIGSLWVMHDLNQRVMSPMEKMFSND